MAVVVVPTSRMTVSPVAIIPAACTPMLDFCSGASHDDSKGRSPSSPDGGTAPPRTLRTRALASSAVRSARTVTADTPNRPARSVTRANPSSQMIPAMRAWRTSASGFSSETPWPYARYVKSSLSFARKCGGGVRRARGPGGCSG